LENLSEILSIPNEGTFYTFTQVTARQSTFLNNITKKCYLPGKSCESNKVGDMKPIQKLLARIMLGSIFPRSGSPDQLSWDHRHFVYFLSRGMNMNWAKYIFHHLTKSIKASQDSSKINIHVIYPRMISEIFYQCGVIDAIRTAGATELLKGQRASFIYVATLSHIRFINDKKNGLY
jgi:hypothetical protein